MLAISKERYLPSTVNTLVLQDEDFYYYVHRDIYDKVVILEDRYSFDDLSALIPNKVNSEAAKWFYETAPKPVRILAPFLGLVDGELELDMTLCCGVLHVITSNIDIRNFTKLPFELRKSAVFSLSIKEEFELAWEGFFMTARPYTDRQMVPVNGVPVVYGSMNMPMVPAGMPYQGGYGEQQAQQPQVESTNWADYDDEDVRYYKYHPDWIEMDDNVYINPKTGETWFSEELAEEMSNDLNNDENEDEDKEETANQSAAEEVAAVTAQDTLSREEILKSNAPEEVKIKRLMR